LAVVVDVVAPAPPAVVVDVVLLDVVELVVFPLPVPFPPPFPGADVEVVELDVVDDDEVVVSGTPTVNDVDAATESPPPTSQWASTW
jgi:hypothetical protein